MTVRVPRIVVAALLLVSVANAKAVADKTALVVSGTVTAHELDLATTATEQTAREAGHVVAKSSFTPREAATITGCVTAPQPWSCIAAVTRGKGLQQVAVVSVVTDTSRDGTPMIVITEQILVEKLDAAIAMQRFCMRCTDDVLVSDTTELTRTLFQQVAVRNGRTVVTISTTPRGARITFDGDSIGATDRSFNTFPGHHAVVLELDDYRRETRSVDAALDKTTELFVTMQPATGPPARPDDRGDSRDARPTAERASLLAPKLVIGAGALALLSGAVLLPFNQHPVTAPIGTEQPQHYRDTVTPGVGLMIGGAAIGVGGYLWWRYRKSTIAPAIAPVPGGATVGVTKAF